MDKKLKKTQTDFIHKMDELINKLDTDIRISKRKRVINKIKKEINIDDKPVE